MTRIACALLVLILIVALALRVWGIDFPNYHWDERDDANLALYAAFAGGELPQYFHGSMLPYIFLLLWGVRHLLLGLPLAPEALLEQYYADPAAALVWPRLFVALCGVASVAVAWRLGERFFRPRTGLIAAWLLAACLLHVMESHYARGHAVAALGIALLVLQGADIVRSGSRRAYALAGLWLGVATAAQYGAALAALPLLAAHLLRRQRRQRRLLLAGATACFVFFALTPYALLDHAAFAEQMIFFFGHEAQRIFVSSEGLPVIAFYLLEHLPVGMGSGFAGLALLGLGYALWRRTPGDWLLLLFPLALLLSWCRASNPNFARYAVPMLPLLAVLAARVLDDLVTRFTRHPGMVLAALAFLLMLQPLQQALRFDLLLTRPDTRQQAALWAAAHLPAGAAVAVEGGGVIGPPLRIDVAAMAAVMAQEPDRFDRAYQQARIRAAGGPGGVRVAEFYRFDRRYEHGQPVAVIHDAAVYSAYEYLVTADWMQRFIDDGYDAAFAQSLTTHFTPVARFVPSPAFRWDYLAYRLDADALTQVTPSAIGGPLLTVYRRR